MSAQEIEQQFALAMRELRVKRGLSLDSLASMLRERGLKFDGPSILRTEYIGTDPNATTRRIRLGDAFVIAESLGSDLNEMLDLARTQKQRRIAALRAELEVLEGGES